MRSNKEERPRGVINQRQREYLREESDIEDQTPAERDIRQSIRENLHNAILDMPLLLSGMEERDRKQALTLAGEWQSEDRQSLEASFWDMIGMIYLFHLDAYDDAMVSPNALFEEAIEQGVTKALNRLGRGVASVEITVDIEYGERFDELDKDDLVKYSESELRQALNADEINPKEYADAINDKEWIADEE